MWVNYALSVLNFGVNMVCELCFVCSNIKGKYRLLTNHALSVYTFRVNMVCKRIDIFSFLFHFSFIFFYLQKQSN